MSASLDLADLAQVTPTPVDQLRPLPELCRGALVSQWAELAGPTVAERVRAQLRADGVASPDVAADDWLPVATYLRLHDVLAMHISAGDRVAFGQWWLQVVGAQIGGPARFAARLFGLRRALEQLPSAWAHGWQLPPPAIQLQVGLLVADFADQPLVQQPTWRWMLALQAALAVQVVTGVSRVEIAATQGAAAWQLRVGWVQASG
ncbi:MAG: hypothetical protein EXR77_17425 [Myxococcales bacterium]|nr:hypothetical protein [Myxococcales bacterium]